jgi:DNA-binding transcriptional regulator YdaS (Cro superfamily)
MDVHQTRRANLRWLIENECEGVAANLARTLGIQATQLSRIFSENARHRRNIGARLARAIEQATSKRRGWMDEPHVAPEAFSPGASKTDQGNAVVLTPFGDRMVPVLDYVQALEWTTSAKPYAHGANGDPLDAPSATERAGVCAGGRRREHDRRVLSGGHRHRRPGSRPAAWRLCGCEDGVGRPRDVPEVSAPGHGRASQVSKDRPSINTGSPAGATRESLRTHLPSDRRLGGIVYP